jgi:hypothetical protein
MKRPRSTQSDVKKGNSNMFGAPASIKVINHYRELIYDFIIDNVHTMYFQEMVDQLLNYNDENKKDFDIVASMGMTELADEELSFKPPQERDPIEQNFQDVGW